MTNDSESQLPAEAADEAGSVADAPAEAVPRARVPELLHAAVASVGGVERPGQLPDGRGRRGRRRPQ